MLGPIFHFVAAHKLGISLDDDTWSIYKSERVGPDFMVTMGQMKLATKGKYKGRKRVIKGTERPCVITQAEIEAEEKAYEVRTGNCADCLGERQKAWSWSATDGTKYRPCKTCKGTGKASQAVAAGAGQATPPNG